MGTAALIVWRFTDGRRGHDVQSRGLTQALSRLHSCTTYDVAVPSRAQSLLDLILCRCPAGAALPDPDLLIGAGHATHLPLLGARRARGGRTVVLMTPSLPTCCFDACLIPDHDSPRRARNIIATRGPLNTIRADGRQRQGPGLILIGGTSRHYHWRQDALLEALRSVLASSRAQWLIGDSPRTPLETRAALHSLAGVNTSHVPWETTSPGWLEEQLQVAPAVWITCDSLSMIHEALTAGAPVGVLDLPRRRTSRVAKAVLRLAEENMITSYAAWRGGAGLKPPATQLNEALRCAALVLQRFQLAGAAAPGQGRTAA